MLQDCLVLYGLTIKEWKQFDLFVWPTIVETFLAEGHTET